MRSVRQGTGGGNACRTPARAPAAYACEPIVFNARINMHTHLRARTTPLSESEARPAWGIFDEMQHAGVAPNEVTYNSLISLCSKLHEPDVPRPTASGMPSPVAERARRRGVA